MWDTLAAAMATRSTTWAVTAGPTTNFEGRILAIRLRILSATGALDTLEAAARLRTITATGELDTAEASATLSTLTATGVLT